MNTFAYVGGALFLAPVTLWQGAALRFRGTSRCAAWLCVVYMALVPSVICYLIYYYALTHIAASRLSAFSYCQPPVAAVLGIFVLGEPITLSLVLAMLVIFAGVYLTERGR